MPSLIQRAFHRSLRGSFEQYCLQTFDLIKICDLASSDDAQQQVFCSRTVKALELIKVHDAKRYRRIQSSLAYIVNSRITSAGVYNHSLRSCAVKSSAFNFEGNEDWGVLMLACVLIHEATHGALLARNIPYDTDRYIRIEKICHQEETRFARRVMPGVDLGAFDGSRHEEVFHMSNWKHVVKYVKKVFQPEQPAV